jgi:hypothetical protein
MRRSSITNQIGFNNLRQSLAPKIEAPELSDDLSTTDRLTPVFQNRSTPLLRWDVFLKGGYDV